MKTLYVSLAFLIVIGTLSAQTELRVGAILAPQVNYEIGKNETPAVTPGFLAHSVLVTPITYHLAAYAFHGNEIVVLNGVFIGANSNLKLIATKKLNVNDGFLGIGYEYTITNGTCSANAFIELGTVYDFSKTLINVGISIPFTVKIL